MGSANLPANGGSRNPTFSGQRRRPGGKNESGFPFEEFGANPPVRPAPKPKKKTAEQRRQEAIKAGAGTAGATGQGSAVARPRVRPGGTTLLGQAGTAIRTLLT